MSCGWGTQCLPSSFNGHRPTTSRELTRSRSLPSSSMSVTNFSMGWADLDWKACLGRATSLGQSSSPGSPITLQKNQKKMWTVAVIWLPHQILEQARHGVGVGVGRGSSRRPSPHDRKDFSFTLQPQGRHAAQSQRTLWSSLTGSKRSPWQQTLTGGLQGLSTVQCHLDTPYATLAQWSSTLYLDWTALWRQAFMMPIHYSLTHYFSQVFKLKSNFLNNYIN